jgi:hypothetical protein
MRFEFDIFCGGEPFLKEGVLPRAPSPKNLSTILDVPKSFFLRDKMETKSNRRLQGLAGDS